MQVSFCVSQLIVMRLPLTFALSSSTRGQLISILKPPWCFVFDVFWVCLEILMLYYHNLLCVHFVIFNTVLFFSPKNVSHSNSLPNRNPTIFSLRKQPSFFAPCPSGVSREGRVLFFLFSKAGQFFKRSKFRNKHTLKNKPFKHQTKIN